MREPKRYTLFNAILIKVTALFYLVSFMGCPKAEFSGTSIDQEAYEWISGFSELQEGDSLQFTNGGVITVKNIVNSNSLRLADCVIEDVVHQCQYEILTLQFGSPFDSIPNYLTIYLFPKKKLVMNYSSISALEPEILRLDMTSNNLEIPQSDAYAVSHSLSFEYGENTVEALISQTLGTQTLFASLPPRNFILLKDYGIVEWSDYEGNTFELLD